MPVTSQAYFSPCPRGLEAVLAGEITRAGATHVTPGAGGVAFSGSLEAGYRVNLWSRVASRVLRRVVRGGYKSEDDVYKLAFSVPWRELFAVGFSIRVDVTGVKSPLKSLDFVTLRVKDAICDRFREDAGKRPDVNTREPDVRISVFLTETEATIYLDTSGESLFKRGFRADAGSAPLKENLAAGIVMLTGFQAGDTFFDPMCGSGTFVIEAALIALNIAPGSHRAFGFEKLADFDSALWTRLRDEARAGERPRERLAIHGADINPREVERARLIAKRMGLENVVSFAVGDIVEVTPPEPPGILVANPPYGVRVGEREVLDDLYPKLGAALKARFAGWRCYFFTADLTLPRGVRLKESKRTPLFNGPLECRLFEFKMVAGSNRPV